MANPASVLLVELVMSVDRLIDAANEAEPACSAEGSSWPPVVVLGHVSDVDDLVWSARLRDMVGAQRRGDPPPRYSWWEPDSDQTFATYRDWSVADAAARVMSQRIGLLTLLRDLSTDEWNASAVHETWGEIDVRDLVLHVLAHDEEHRASLLLARES